MPLTAIVNHGFLVHVDENTSAFASSSSPMMMGGPMSPVSPELGDNEKHRQNLIRELIDTEEQYVTALSTAKDVSQVK